MSFTDQDVYSFYSGNGATKNFSIGFELQENAQVVVKLYDTTTKSEALQTEGVDYDLENTVTPLVPDPANRVAFVTAPATGKQVRIYRATALTQEEEIENNGTPQASRIEAALDKAVMMTQEVAALAGRAVLRDVLDSGLDTVLPPKSGNGACVVMLNTDEDALVWGPTAGDISAAEGFAEAAAAAQASAEAAQAAADAAVADAETAVADAEAAQNAAEAAQAAAEAASAAAEEAQETFVASPHNVTDGQSATNLTGETLDSADYSSAVYTYEIIRGTTVFSTGRFSLHYRDSEWRLVYPWGDNRDDDSAAHGVTFSLSGTTTAQLKAALDVGAGNGTIKLACQRFAV